jgi:pilus assembly protein CpaB
MKQAQIIGISIALVAGGAAFFIAKTFTRPPPAPLARSEKLDTVQVLVARADIGLGEVANEASFRWQDWPKQAVSTSFITRTNRPTAPRDFSGTVARSSLLAGEPVTTSKLIKAGAGGVLAAILPPGMRAMAIKINESTAVGRLILPNDHVDVLLSTRTRSRTGGGEEISTEVILRNIRVLAIGQQIEVKEGRKNSEGNVATLEISPGQAEIVAQASMRGELSLALRSIADIGTGQGGAPQRNLDRGNAVKVLRYGVKSKAYGVN